MDRKAEQDLPVLIMISATWYRYAMGRLYRMPIPLYFFKITPLRILVMDKTMIKADYLCQPITS